MVKPEDVSILDVRVVHHVGTLLSTGEQAVFDCIENMLEAFSDVSNTNLSEVRGALLRGFTRGQGLIFFGASESSRRMPRQLGESQLDMGNKRSSQP